MGWERRRYAVIGWCSSDILEIRPRWTRKQCKEFLVANEGRIKLAMIDAGESAIRECLPAGWDDTEEEEGDE